MTHPDEPQSPARRRFLGVLLGGSLTLLGVTVAIPALRYIFPPKAEEVLAEQVEVGKVADIPKNSGKIFRFQGRPAILIHTADDRFKALDAVCTHLNCTVQYQPEKKAIWCACHGGTYDLNGNVVSGPPPRALKPYTVTLRGETIVVSKG